jgi:hypothetical protein
MINHVSCNTVIFLDHLRRHEIIVSDDTCLSPVMKRLPNMGKSGGHASASTKRAILEMLSLKFASASEIAHISWQIIDVSIKLPSMGVDAMHQKKQRPYNAEILFRHERIKVVSYRQSVDPDNQQLSANSHAI